MIEDQGVRGVLLAIGGSEIELLRADARRHRRGAVPRRPAARECTTSASNPMMSTPELEAARAKGIELIDQKPRPGLAGMICFLHPKSNHGVLIEFATPPAEGHSRDDRGHAYRPCGYQLER